MRARDGEWRSRRGESDPGVREKRWRTGPERSLDEIRKGRTRERIRPRSVESYEAGLKPCATDENYAQPLVVPQFEHL